MPTYDDEKYREAEDWVRDYLRALGWHAMNCRDLNRDKHIHHDLEVWHHSEDAPQAFFVEVKGRTDIYVGQYNSLYESEEKMVPLWELHMQKKVPVLFVGVFNNPYSKGELDKWETLWHTVREPEYYRTSMGGRTRQTREGDRVKRMFHIEWRDMYPGGQLLAKHGLSKPIKPE